MIRGNLNNLDTDIDPKVLNVLKKLKDEDLISLELGKHNLNGNEYFMRLDYETKDIEETSIEAHKKYIDVHIVLSGTEIIEVEEVANLQIESEYNQREDYLILTGSTSESIVLNEEDFLVCYPKNAHRVGLKNNEKKKISKIVVKLMAE